MKIKFWNFKEKKTLNKGWFDYFNLTHWWETTFSESEKIYILETYKPMGGSSEDLIKGDFSGWETTNNAISLLTVIAGYFLGPQDRKYSYLILDKAEGIISNEIPIIDNHFLYQTKIKTYYRDRNKDNFYFQTAIEACHQQIKISRSVKSKMIELWGEPLPSHESFEQLAIVLEKQKKYEEAIELCKKAQNEGWNGDWEKRIDRCTNKQDKLKRPPNHQGPKSNNH